MDGWTTTRETTSNLTSLPGRIKKICVPYFVIQSVEKGISVRSSALGCNPVCVETSSLAAAHYLSMPTQVPPFREYTARQGVRAAPTTGAMSRLER
jgi:hypothetical protein